MNAPNQPQSKSQQDELDRILKPLQPTTAAFKKQELQSYIDKAVAQEANKARIDEIKWALSRTSMDELKERYEALTAQNKDRA